MRTTSWSGESEASSSPSPVRRMARRAVRPSTSIRPTELWNVGPATTRLTNEDCSPTGFHWAFDTYSQAVGTAKAVVASGGKSWFILAADYAFGHQMAADLDRVVKESGGTVLGQVRHPTGTGRNRNFRGRLTGIGAHRLLPIGSGMAEDIEFYATGIGSTVERTDRVKKVVAAGLTPRKAVSKEHVPSTDLRSPGAVSVGVRARKSVVRMLSSDRTGPPAPRIFGPGFSDWSFPRRSPT